MKNSKKEKSLGERGGASRGYFKARDTLKTKKVSNFFLFFFLLNAFDYLGALFLVKQFFIYLKIKIRFNIINFL